MAALREQGIDPFGETIRTGTVNSGQLKENIQKLDSNNSTTWTKQLLLLSGRL